MKQMLGILKVIKNKEKIKKKKKLHQNLTDELNKLKEEK